MRQLKALVRRVLARFLAPVTFRLDRLAEMDTRLAVLHGEMSARIDDLTGRITAMERTLQTMEGRNATVSERQSGCEEDQRQLAHRLHEIEELLAEGQS